MTQTTSGHQDAIPRMLDGVQLESTSGQHYLYNSKLSAYVLLDNQVAIEVIRLCDGKRNVRSISEEIARCFRGAHAEKIVEDVLGMLERLRQEAFIALDRS